MGTREALLAAAERLIREKGAKGFSLREAARAVKVDPAMVYRHFDGRDDLVHAVADGGVGRLAKAMAQAARGAKDPELRLRRYGRAYLRFALNDASTFRLIFGPDRGRGLPGAETPFAALVQCVTDLAAKRQLDLDARKTAAVCWAALHGIATLALDGALERSAGVGGDELSEVMIDLLVDGLFPPAARR